MPPSDRAMAKGICPHLLRSKNLKRDVSLNLFGEFFMDYDRMS